MKKIIVLLLFFFVSVLILSGCSSSDETTKENTDDSYIFDEMPPDSSMQLENPTVKYPDLNVTYYVVQIGAFTTRDKAETFAEESRKKLLKEISVSYSMDVNLYVVQLSPLYTSRSEAEAVRNKLWQKDGYNDA